MKAYVMLTGIVFGLITVAHVLRAIQEGPGVLNVWWILLPVVTSALSVWAFRLLRLVFGARPVFRPHGAIACHSAATKPRRERCFVFCVATTYSFGCIPRLSTCAARMTSPSSA